MNIVISGSTGLIGSALTAHFRKQGYIVKRLVRKEGGLAHDEISWDPENGKIEIEPLEKSDVWINLAGENIAHGRWNESKKKKILNSRIKSTQLLSKTLKTLNNPPALWINASAVGYYGNREDETLDEQSAPGKTFLSEVCQAWEAAVQAPDSVRTVLSRFGVVLASNGGALKQMLLPFRLGLGGVLGSGKQFMSWIALNDLVSAIDFIITEKSVKGPVNMVTPYPVTNQEFTKVLGEVLNRPTILRMPAFAARLIFGEMAEELLLSHAKVEPQKLMKAKFSFAYPHLKEALHALIDDKEKIAASF